MLQEHLIWSNEFLPRAQRAEVHFASLFSGGFITVIVVNPPEKKLAKRTSVYWSGQCTEVQFDGFQSGEISIVTVVNP